MSWYFDTENWAAGIWNSWAEERTDSWREAMVGASSARGQPRRRRPGVRHHTRAGPSNGDFSFLVIGDTGEGDASQHSLRDQLPAGRPARHDVKFVVISSDVVYPDGAMRDYEAKFWLPFMGTPNRCMRSPATTIGTTPWRGSPPPSCKPDAARAAMRARVEADNRITSTTDRRIERAHRRGLAAQARSTACRRSSSEAPFFQFQTDSFALFAVDTGVARRVDPAQRAWLAAALGSARGKMKMAILGHPLYAGGLHLGDSDGVRRPPCPAARARRRDRHGRRHPRPRILRRAHGAALRMMMHHFVNGGGGAYLSFGTALAWPARPATAEWAFYPTRDQVVAKIEATTPAWKRPAWWWTKRLGGWPFSAEWLSAAFDANVAPFYQSFIEVRVEPSRRRIRLLPVRRPRPTDLDRHGSVGRRAPLDAVPGSPVEWVVKMGQQR